MAEKRYALLIANSASFTGESGQEIPAASLTTSLDLIRQSITNLGEYSFGWPDNKSNSSRPHTLSRGTWGSFISVLEENAQYFDEETLFLLYYFGHGVVHSNRLHVAFGNSGAGKANKRPLSDIVNELYSVGVRKLILIADNCHAGRAKQDFQVQPTGLQYYVLAASSGGYTYYDRNGGRWTSALSQAIERYNQHKLVVRGTQDATFAKWFENARELAEASDLHPHSLSGGLEDHTLFVRERRVPSRVLGSRTDRTIYNRLYLLLSMLSKQAQSASELHARVRDQSYRVFLLASGSAPEASDTYVSLETVERYLARATQWGLVALNPRVANQRILTDSGQAALADAGRRYNEILREGIYLYLAGYGVNRDFITRTMVKIMKSFDAPSVNAFLREIRYESVSRSVDRASLEFALRMLSQSREFEKSTGSVFFPAEPSPDR